ncbi:atrial natriuretic peptide receptor 2-like [Paramacrobiotus metropolitanus]|uniref:atrial natriuretic peptide receptor 2-like n=1 Tax=Paramacrobiotus metropolitanus TaxID=2943436 RepID=UPI002445F650|nr:atrial natriuretic peptide receptor 2-like [Paramacrobiotus metropolitanus]
MSVIAVSLTATVTKKQARLNTIFCRLLHAVNALHHRNLSTLLGVTFTSAGVYLLYEYNVRGHLRHLLASNKLLTDLFFRLSFLQDILEGMTFIHRSLLHCHGMLNTEVCLIDHRFAVKLLRNGQIHMDIALTKTPKNSRRGQSYNDHDSPSQRSDIIQLGTIILEVITTGVQQGTPHYDALAPYLRRLAESCMAELSRPSANQIRTSLNAIAKECRIGTVPSMLLEELQRHTDQLENLVRERTMALVVETRKVDELLLQILPAYVSILLQHNSSVTM